MELTIEKGIAMPEKAFKGNQYTIAFKQVKPFLNEMDEVGQSVFYPTEKPDNMRRELTWIMNKYAPKLGKNFSAVSVEKVKPVEADPENGIEAVEGVTPGVRIFLTETGLKPVTDMEVPETVKKRLGNIIDLDDETTDEENNGEETVEEAKEAPKVQAKGKGK